MERKEADLGVRKGAWTKQEDLLLTKCVHDFGEGKWHLVPLRTGLKRCRKSCRMRWLNYLHPNLKKGHFTKDEVDLILKMHKLLGNRWSLIAGRIPGRTANDVKNYWNCHICKKLKPSSSDNCSHDEIRRAATAKTSSTNIIKPRPRAFTVSEAAASSSALMLLNREANDNGQNLELNRISTPLMVEQGKDESRLRWWTNLLQISEGEGEGNPTLFSDENRNAMLSISSPEAYINLDE